MVVFFCADKEENDHKMPFFIRNEFLTFELPAIQKR